MRMPKKKKLSCTTRRFATSNNNSFITIQQIITEKKKYLIALTIPSSSTKFLVYTFHSSFINKISYCFDKCDTYLLIELLQMWENYKVMTKCFSGIFMYLIITLLVEEAFHHSMIL